MGAGTRGDALRCYRAGSSRSPGDIYAIYSSTRSMEAWNIPIRRVSTSFRVREGHLATGEPGEEHRYRDMIMIR